MTTYVYETIPSKAGEEPVCFEVQQGMNDARLTKHPETGEPVRRVVLGGYGVLGKKEAAEDEDCGSGCCCG